MDSAGSIAVDEERAKRLKQEYYNVVGKGRGEPNNRNNKDVVSCSSCSPTLSRPKKILSGRIVKKYRLSLRNVVHSTQQQWRQRGMQNETCSTAAGHRIERLSLRDQINHWHLLDEDLFYLAIWTVEIITNYRGPVLSVQLKPVRNEGIPAPQCWSFKYYFMWKKQTRKLLVNTLYIIYINRWQHCLVYSVKQTSDWKTTQRPNNQYSKIVV